MDRHSDDELLALAPARPEAFAAFYRRHERLLLGYFMRRTRPGAGGGPDRGGVAAALVSVRRSIRARAGGGLAARIAANTFRRACEHGSVEDRARRKLGMGVMVLEDEALKRIERIGGDERAEALLAHLPPDQAHAIRARVIDERDYDHIAAELRCSQSVVRQRVSRGLATLRSIAPEEE